MLEQQQKDLQAVAQEFQSNKIAQKYYLNALHGFNTAIEKVAWQLGGSKAEQAYSVKWYMSEMHRKQSELREFATLCMGRVSLPTTCSGTFMCIVFQFCCCQLFPCHCTAEAV